MAKVGRNKLCPCGSGKKYKHCCGNPLNKKSAKKGMHFSPGPGAEFRQLEAKEKTRIEQQGRGRPIISMDHAGHKVVAVGSTIHFSKKWIYFADFLMDYVKKKFSGEWGNAEIEKPFEERHPLMQWYHLFGEFQAKLAKDEDGHYEAQSNGLVNCYLGLAYNLYLLEHNAELQIRYIKRLKKPDQFQGAYYELIVANCLIRAGFELELEDEEDETRKHCEFSALSNKTGKKYWVEAKMRSVSGVLGKTDIDGQPSTSKPTSRLSTHLRDALRKPANDERIVFIDVNTEPMTPEDFAGGKPNVPEWMLAAERQFQDRERDWKQGECAYVFVTNFCFHNALDATDRGPAVRAFGLGIDDYGKSRSYTLKEAWRVKQKHVDIFALEDALKSYPKIPRNFDGDLPPVAKGERERITIGKTYNFTDSGVIGEITSATVAEDEKKVYVAIAGTDGKSHILTEDISDQELEIYRTYPDTYFGVVHPATKKTEDPYELFEWMLNSYKNTSKERLLELMNEAPDIEVLRKLDQEELSLEFCERNVLTIMQKQASKSNDKHDESARSVEK